MRGLVIIGLLIGGVACSNIPDQKSGPGTVWTIREYSYGAAVLRTFKHNSTGACFVSNSYDGGIVEAPTAVCETEE